MCGWDESESERARGQRTRRVFVCFMRCLCDCVRACVGEYLHIIDFQRKIIQYAHKIEISWENLRA